MHLGIGAVRGEDPDAFVPIIEKGTPYPLLEPKKKLFSPTEENQRELRIPVYEGLSTLASLNDHQGTIEVPLPEGVKRSQTIEVSFSYDHNRLLTVDVCVVGTAMRHSETLRRNSPPPRRTLLEDWREELQPAMNTAQEFYTKYHAYMEPADLAELKQAMEQGARALSGTKELEGKQATSLLHNKILSSGIASLLFMAEKVMPGAGPKETQELAQATAELRSAHDRKDRGTVDRVASQLRLTVAQMIASHRAVAPVADRKDFAKKLRVRD